KAQTGEPTKLQAKFKGPFVISKILPSDTYGITDLRNQNEPYLSTRHASQIKLFKIVSDDDLETDNDEQCVTDDDETLNSNEVTTLNNDVDVLSTTSSQLANSIET